jgi:hypothetical protein
MELKEETGMEHEPRRPDEEVSAQSDEDAQHYPAALIPDGAGSQPAAELAHREIAITFGYLNPNLPDVNSWREQVIARGIVEATRENRLIDDRTVLFIADFLAKPSMPALRKLAATGAVDQVMIEEELTSLHADQTVQVQEWMTWLAHYCASRADLGEVPDWWRRMAQQDRQDVERIRGEHVMRLAEDFFESLPAEVIEAAGDRDLSAIVRYIDSLGGLILTYRASGAQEVWATDSETELEERWAEISAQSPEPPEPAWLLRLPPSGDPSGQRAVAPGGTPPSSGVD